MENTLDKTSRSAISQLEARLLRIEHLLYGPSAIPTMLPADTALDSLATLERRFAGLINRFRVYAELLILYKSHPSLFQSTSDDNDTIPTQLSPKAIRATVLACAASFHATASALSSAFADSPLPDASLSAELVALMPRMRGLVITQRAQDAEIAALRARGEKCVRRWYEGNVLRYGTAIADAEERVNRCERGLRRADKMKEEISGQGQ